MIAFAEVENPGGVMRRIPLPRDPSFLHQPGNSPCLPAKGFFEFRIVLDNLIEELRRISIDDVETLLQILFGWKDDLTAYPEFLNAERQRGVERKNSF